METKVCNKCNIKKDVTEFYSGRKNTNKFFNTCKVCKSKIGKEYYNSNKEMLKERSKKYYENNKEMSKVYRKNNKEKLLEYQKEYYENNKEMLKERSKKYYENNKERVKKRINAYHQKNSEQFSEYQKEYYKNNKERKRKMEGRNRKNRRESDPLFKLRCNIRSLISQSYYNNGYTKNSKSFKILGCSYEDFKEHIESHWEDWMNWDNYGIYNGKEKCGWDLDHIIPVGSAECEEDIYKLNHHSNIQPLCSYINRNVKRDIIDWES